MIFLDGRFHQNNAVKIAEDNFPYTMDGMLKRCFSLITVIDHSL